MNVNQIATNYNEIMAALNAMDEPRHEMYNATNRIRAKVDACANWQGEDAEAYKQVLRRVCQQTDNCAKWMNAVCLQLKQLAEEMKQNAENQAAMARQFSDQNMGGMF